MKTDLYTKTMLTLIVLFLGILSFDRVYDSFVREAEASNGNWDCTTMNYLDIHMGLEEEIINRKNWSQIEMAQWENPKSHTPGVLVCGK